MMTQVASVVSGSIVCLQIFTMVLLKIYRTSMIFKRFFFEKRRQYFQKNNNSRSYIKSYFTHQREIFLTCANQAYIISHHAYLDNTHRAPTMCHTMFQAGVNKHLKVFFLYLIICARASLITSLGLRPTFKINILIFSGNLFNLPTILFFHSFIKG